MSFEATNMKTYDTRTIVRFLDATHLGATITLPTLQAPGHCRKGTLMAIRPDNSTDTSTLVISDHQHQVPNGATVWVERTAEVRGL